MNNRLLCKSRHADPRPARGCAAAFSAAKPVILAAVTAVSALLWQCTTGRDNPFDPKSSRYRETKPVYPLAVLQNLPGSITGDNSIDVTVGGVGVTAYRYSLDGAEYSQSRPVDLSITASGLEEGSHTLAVLGENASGLVQQVDNLSFYTWTVDTTGPIATLTGTPSQMSTSDALDINVSGSETAAYRYSLDSAEYSSERSTAVPITVEGLADGDHTLEVIARDTAGNWQSMAAPTAYNWSVDATLPEIISVSPSDGAGSAPPCSGSPCRARLVFQFSEAITSTTVPLIAFEDIHSGYTNINDSTSTSPSDGAFSWSQTVFQNDTLTVTLNMVRFPENFQLRYTLYNTGLSDSYGNRPVDRFQGSFTTDIMNVHFMVADTGQSTCYNATAAQACNDTSDGDIFPAQDGDFSNTPAARSYTGPAAHGVYTSDYTTTDNITGLVWKTCSEGQSAPACSGSPATFTWYQAVDTCSYLNQSNSNSGYAARTDWRLPTLQELQTITDYSVSYPSIDVTYFPGTASERYWSATTTIDSSGSSNFSYLAGDVNANANSLSLYVRCVSSATASESTPSLTDNGDGTITDNINSLIWQKCSHGKNNDATCSGSLVNTDWQTALNTCYSLGLAGRSWRLPSFREWSSIILFNSTENLLDRNYFPEYWGTNYWSSTTYAGSNERAFQWLTNTFNTAPVAKSNSQAVRCVSSL